MSRYLRITSLLNTSSCSESDSDSDSGGVEVEKPAITQRSPLPLPPPPPYQEGTTVRKPLECQQCRAKNIRCKKWDSTRCQACFQNNLVCDWAPKKTHSHGSNQDNDSANKDGSLDHILHYPETPSNKENATSTTSNTSGAAFLGPATAFGAVIRTKSKIPQEEVMRRFYSEEISADVRDAIVYYFQYFYGICPIFHPATFIRRVVQGEVDVLLIDAMRASAARIITKYTGRKVDIEKTINDVQQRLLLGIENPTLDFVRAVALLTALCGGECSFTTYNSLACLASSLVTRLGWHMLDFEAPRGNMSWEEWMTLEIKRHTFWVVFEIDSYLGLISDRPMAISVSRMYVSAPGSDSDWNDVSIARPDKWPAYYQSDMPKEEIIRTGYFQRSVVDVCNLTWLMSDINNFLWEIKVDPFSQSGLARYLTADIKHTDLLYNHVRPKTYRPVHSLFECKEFRGFHQRLVEWKRGLVCAEDMKEYWIPDLPFTQFGNLQHRQSTMRSRYFCLYFYHFACVLLMHFSNRPSFFRGQQQNQQPVAPSTNPNQRPPPLSALAGSDGSSIEDKAIRQMLSMVFSDSYNDGVLAYDIVKESWDVCLDAVHDAVAFIKRNDDIPLERYDQVTPFFLFTSLTVLIRQIRLCRLQIKQNKQAKQQNDTQNPHRGAASVQDVYDELFKHVGALRFLWKLLKNLTGVWRIEGMEYLLQTMKIEEMANAADLFSGLTL